VSVAVSAEGTCGARAFPGDFPGSATPADSRHRRGARPDPGTAGPDPRAGGARAGPDSGRLADPARPPSGGTIRRTPRPDATSFGHPTAGAASGSSAPTAAPMAARRWPGARARVDLEPVPSDEPTGARASHAREIDRPHRAGTPGTRTPGRGLHQPADRQGPVHHREDGERPRDAHPWKAAHGEPSLPPIRV